MAEKRNLARSNGKAWKNETKLARHQRQLDLATHNADLREAGASTAWDLAKAERRARRRNR